MSEQNRCAVIISAVPLTADMAAYLQRGDTVIACDAGYRNAQVLGVVPDLIVGDFDSAPRPDAHGGMIVLPHVKDDTDTHYAARWLLEHGYRHITMLGALGGARMEHTIANLGTALYLARRGAEVLLAGERSELRILCPGIPLTLPRKDWTYLSIYPLEGTLSGVCLSGVFYPLQNVTVTMEQASLTTSNEFTAPQAVLSCQSGFGLVVLSHADHQMEGN